VKSGAERDTFVTGGNDVILSIGITSALQCSD